MDHRVKPGGDEDRAIHARSATCLSLFSAIARFVAATHRFVKHDLLTVKSHQRNPGRGCIVVAMGHVRGTRRAARHKRGVREIMIDRKRDLQTMRVLTSNELDQVGGGGRIEPIPTSPPPPEPIRLATVE